MTFIFKKYNTIIINLGFILLLCMSNSVFSQGTTSQERKLLKQAREALDDENYVKAQNTYKKLLDIKKESDIYNFETGLSYFYSNYQREKTIPYLEDALKYSTEDTIPEIYYYLAKAYHFNGDYKKSERAYALFIPKIKVNTLAGRRLIENVNNLNKYNKNAAILNLNKHKITIRNIGANINTPEQEYAPVIKDSITLLFTSRRKGQSNKLAEDLMPYEDIYLAKFKNNTWVLENNELNSGEYIPPHINTKKHDAAIIYSKDGKTFYSYKKNKIWYSTHKDGKWTDLKLLDEEINGTGTRVPSTSLTSDQEKMFFVTAEKKGFGGKDIYMSQRLENGKWSEPKNLGEVINTPEDEDAPYLSPDGKTLYFSSKGHDGIGGYDIYKSEINNGKLSEPVNMGIPVNSSADDIYYVTEKDENTGFFSSNRNGGFGGMDIYSFCIICPTNININGIIVDQQGNNLNQETNVTFKYDEKDSLIASAKTTDAKFEFFTTSTGKHSLAFNSNGYKQQKLTFDLPDSSADYKFVVKLFKIADDEYNYQVVNLTSEKLNLNLSDTIKTAKELLAQVDRLNLNGKVLNKSTRDGLSNVNVDLYTKNKNNWVKINSTKTDDSGSWALNPKKGNEDFKLEFNKDDFESSNVIVDRHDTTSDLTQEQIDELKSIDLKYNGTVKPQSQGVLASYKQLFDYNKTEVNVENKDFISLINAISKKSSKGEKLVIEIYSSASKVPTKTFKTNINLAQKRGEEAKAVLLKALKAKGINTNTVKVNKIDAEVNGPKYHFDYKNTERYKKYQYVIIKLLK